MILQKECSSTLQLVSQDNVDCVEHPSSDVLERYLINHLPDDQTALVERHVFSCNSCLSRTRLLDLEELAVAKACEILSGLEREGVRMLSVPTFSEQRLPARILTIPMLGRTYNMRAALAATMLLTVGTLSSLSFLNNRQPQHAAVSYAASAPVARAVYPSSDFELPLVRATESAAKPRRRVARVTPPLVVQARYVRPFIAPQPLVETPEPSMAFIAPVVLAQQRTEPPVPMTRQTHVPKPRVKQSKRVLQAIANPFKKLGGALASIAVGDTEMNDD